MAGLIALPCALAERIAPPPTRASQFNLLFTTAPSYSRALERYHHLRPPAYPTLLFAATRAGISPRRLQQGLFAVTLLLLLTLARRHLGPLPPLGVTAFYAVCSFNVWVLGQLWAESLVVPLALALFLALDAHARRPGCATLLQVSLLVSLACLTRTFCAFWLAPIAAARLLLAPGLALRTRALHVAIYASVVGLPLALWTRRVHQRTGFSTGMDRWSWESRPIPHAHADWPQLTSFAGNLQRGAATLLLDFLSPTRLASHEALARPFSPTPIETAAAGLLLAGLAILGLRWRRRAPARAPDATPPVEAAPGALLLRWLAEAPAALLASFVLVYLSLLLLLWSLSNNDPLWSRFLLPCYVFIVAGAGLAWARLLQRDVDALTLTVVRAGVACLALLQLWRWGALSW